MLGDGSVGYPMPGGTRIRTRSAFTLQQRSRPGGGGSAGSMALKHAQAMALKLGLGEAGSGGVSLVGIVNARAREFRNFGEDLHAQSGSGSTNSRAIPPSQAPAFC